MADTAGILDLSVWKNNPKICLKISFSAGRRTATGERLDPRQLTAASLQLPLKSQTVVTNLDNGRSVRVRINDCGPYARGRKLDFSKRAAQELAMTHEGTVPVRIRLVA